MEDHTKPPVERQDESPFSNERRISRKSPIAHVGYEAKIILNTDRTTVKRRVIIDRETGSVKPPVETSTRTGGGKRGRVFEFSRSSRRTFFARANSIAGLVYMATFTYPDDAPASPDSAKKDWDALRRWVVGHGTYGMMVREYQERGAVHYHLITSEHLPVDRLSERWARITGAGDDSHAKRYGVRVREMYDVSGAIRYLGKREQKQHPETEQSFGRIWSEFGDIQRYSTETFVGNQKAVAPLLRVLRGLERASRRTRQRRPRNDKGIYGFTAWGATDQAFRARLPELFQLFGISAHRDEKTGDTFLTLRQGANAPSPEEGDKASV